LLGDQPSVRPSSVATLTEAWRQGAGPVVQATYHGRPGHPILFDREVWPDLEAVSGDQGARALLARHPDWRALVPIEGPFPPDIDTEEDYRRARKAFEHLS